MASQMFGVTGNRRLKRNQKAELNAKLKQLPSILAAEQAAEQQRKEQEFRERQLSQEKKIAKDEMKFKRSESKRAFGLEMGKTGINLGMSGMLSDLKFGDIPGKIGGMFGGGTKGAPSAQNPTHEIAMTKSGTPSSTGGFFSNMPVGSVLAGGLGGFGAASMFGGKSTSKKLLFGGLAGAGLGLLSGGLSGALGGAAGGLFGGLMG